MNEPRISEYALCKHMGISQQVLDDMAEEDVLAWQWIMRREFKEE